MRKYVRINIYCLYEETVNPVVLLNSKTLVISILNLQTEGVCGGSKLSCSDQHLGRSRCVISCPIRDMGGVIETSGFAVVVLNLNLDLL